MPSFSFFVSVATFTSTIKTPAPPPHRCVPTASQPLHAFLVPCHIFQHPQLRVTGSLLGRLLTFYCDVHYSTPDKAVAVVSSAVVTPCVTFSDSSDLQLDSLGMLAFPPHTFLCILSVPGVHYEPGAFSHRTDKDQCLPFNSAAPWSLDLHGDLRHRDPYEQKTIVKDLVGKFRMGGVQYLLLGISAGLYMELRVHPACLGMEHTEGHFTGLF